MDVFWYWAAPGGGDAGDRFVIAEDQVTLWPRVAAEIGEEHPHWNKFQPTLAGCFYMWITAREMYGANYNRVLFELTQVPAFRALLKRPPFDLCNVVSNPMGESPLNREPYSQEALERLADIIGWEL